MTWAEACSAMLEGKRVKWGPWEPIWLSVHGGMMNVAGRYSPDRNDIESDQWEVVDG